jgi:hypothetical protein
VKVKGQKGVRTRVTCPNTRKSTHKLTKVWMFDVPCHIRQNPAVYEDPGRSSLSTTAFRTSSPVIVILTRCIACLDACHDALPVDLQELGTTGEQRTPEKDTETRSEGAYSICSILIGSAIHVRFKSLGSLRKLFQKTRVHRGSSGALLANLVRHSESAWPRRRHVRLAIDKTPTEDQYKLNETKC